MLGLVVAAGLAGSRWDVAPRLEAKARTADAASSQSSSTFQTISPGDDIQARVDAAPPGTTFLLTAGVHRMHSIVPKNGDVFTGEPGAVLSGARLLTTAARSGSYLGGCEPDAGRRSAGYARRGNMSGRCSAVWLP